jgi:hypothetical protein
MGMEDLVLLAAVALGFATCMVATRRLFRRFVTLTGSS